MNTQTTVLVQKRHALLLLQQGQTEEARDRIAEICKSNPRDVEAWQLMNAIHELQGNMQGAEFCARQIIALTPASYKAHSNLGSALLAQGRLDEAATSFREALRLNPESSQDKYLLAAVSGTQPPGRHEAAAYVAKLFDVYAERFDEHLAGQLGYRIPQVLHEVLAQLIEPEPNSLDILDMGCGTGLCGPLFRPWARRLCGVDLSQRMLDKARRRHVYDELICGDLIAPLRTPGAAFDLMIAADVFIYVGALDDTFSACAAALRPNGLLAFSIEALDNDNDYLLRPTTRYAHSLHYVRRLALAENMQVSRIDETIVRKEKGTPVKAYVCILRKP